MSGCGTCLGWPPCPRVPVQRPAVSGLNIYDVLESCYHGHNPYTAGEQPSAAASPTAQRASLAEALASHRQWPLLGAAQPGPVPGLADVLGLLTHTPPCLDSRWGWAGGWWGRGSWTACNSFLGWPAFQLLLGLGLRCNQSSRRPLPWVPCPWSSA